MNIENLIRTFDDIETPAPGRWSIGAGQPVTVARRRGLRRRLDEGRSVTGALMIADNLDNSYLTITVSYSASEAEDVTVRFVGRLVHADQSGHWRFAGVAHIGNSAVELDTTVDVNYRGVFRHGAVPVAWLGVHTLVDRRYRVARRKVQLELLADLNAEAPLR